MLEFRLTSVPESVCLRLALSRCHWNTRLTREKYAVLLKCCLKASAVIVLLIFTRAALSQRGTCRHRVSVCQTLDCPSVCPSVTSRCSTKTAKPRITQTTPYDSPGTLVFRCQKISAKFQRGRPRRPFCYQLQCYASFRLYRLHCINTAYCYRCRTVCLFVRHTDVPYKNGWTDRDAVWGIDIGLCGRVVYAAKGIGQ